MNAIASLNKLLHGGPDEQSLRWGQGWIFGHTRLSINGLMNGSQPFTGHGLQCLFVGEIYNFKELAQAFSISLTLDGSDGEVLLPLFERFGPRFVEKLEGMYSIAIADTRKGSKFFLFTDPCAIKPVYYKHTLGKLSFASEIEGIPDLTYSDKSISATEFDRYGAYRTILGGQTILPSVRVLEPSSYLEFNGELARIHQYTPETTINAVTQTDFSTDFFAGVNATMMTDVPICTTLSGGLDSSLVTMAASKNLKMTDAFNVWYEGRWLEDETEFAAEVAKQSRLN